jgi:DNA-binding HxlR family transcriptional regulator
MPLQSGYDGQICSIASTLEVVGERWTLLIIREAMLGVHRFDELQSDLGIARNVLQTRLEGLVEHGILEKQLYQERPKRYEYRLTDKGLDLWPTIISLMQWGDRHGEWPSGPPVTLQHRRCGGAVDAHRTCTVCGEKLGARDVWATAGESAGADHPLRRRAHRPAPAAAGAA